MTQQINIIPNPAHDYVTIESEPNAYITILNSPGEEVKCVNADADLSPGLYMVRLDSSVSSHIQKVIVQ